MSEWISIDDRLPEKDEGVIIYPMDGMVGHADYFFNAFSTWGYGEVNGVTHWMPLPEPPKDK